MSCLKASLILVSFNSREDILRCLDSVLQDPWPPEEIIVVDNASQDESAEAVRRSFAQVRLIESAHNRGFGAACNLGAAQASGDYLAFLNPDTIASPGWLRALLQALEENPRAGLATAKILLLEHPERINTCGNAMHLSGLTLCRGLGRHTQAFNRLERVNAVSGAAFAIRRDLFISLGGFDEDFFLYMEDADLSLRARLAGFECLYVPEAQVHHDYRLTFGPRKTFYQERNRYAMLIKAYRWPTLAVLLPALLLAELIAWGFVLLREPRRWRNKLEAYRWVGQNWKRLLSRRRQVQAKRRLSDRRLLSEADLRLELSQVLSSRLGRTAELILTPLFFVCKLLAMGIVWW